MDDILINETIELEFYSTGQEYFNEFLKHNKKMLYENGEEFMKENLPYGYLLLEMSHSNDKVQIETISNQIKSINDNDLSKYNLL